MSLKKYTYEVKHEEKDNYQSKNHCNGKHTEIGDRKMRGKHFLKNALFNWVFISRTNSNRGAGRGTLGESLLERDVLHILRHVTQR